MFYVIYPSSISFCLTLYSVSEYRDLDNAMTWLCDKLAPFRTAQLVKTNDFDAYINLMDKAMEERTQKEQELGIRRSRASGYSSWFKGQNINLDVFGNYASSWKVRKEKEDKFREENL